MSLCNCLRRLMGIGAESVDEARDGLILPRHCPTSLPPYSSKLPVTSVQSAGYSQKLNKASSNGPVCARKRLSVHGM